MKYAIRVLIRTPAFSIPALASLALGIAVNTMMFSLVSATLLRPLGAPDAGRLVRIGRSVGRDNGFRSLSFDEELAIVGLVVGLLIAAGATRLMSALLYGLDAIDPLTFAAVAALLLFVALSAAYAAARAGLSHDPVALLRSE